MLYRFYIILGVAFLCTQINGQNHLSSGRDSVANYLSDSSWRVLKGIGENNPLMMRILLPVSYNLLQINYAGAKGDFILGQGSTVLQRIQLITEGRTTLKKVNLWGRFSFTDIDEDSTRFAHQTRNNNTIPYYLGSPAFVSYNRKVYNLQGQVERFALRSNLPVGFGVDYRVGNHFSTNDPRGEINDFNLNVNGGIGYYIGKKFFISGLYHYGYGQERVAVGYKNRIYLESTIYPLHNTYIINGYGEPNPTLTTDNMRYQNNLRRSGGEATLQYSFTPTHFIMLTGGLRDETQKFWRRGSGLNATDTSFNDYFLNTVSAGLIWKFQSNNSSWSVFLDYKSLDGRDRNYRFNRQNNFLYSQTLVDGKIVLQKSSGSGNIWNFLLRAGKNNQRRQDGIYGNHLSYSTYIVSGDLGYTVQKRGRVFWGGSFSPVIGFSPEADDVYVLSPASSSYFTNGVINHDYLYYTSSYSGGQIRASYNLKVYKEIYAGLAGSIGYTNVSKWRTASLPQESYPGRQRWDYGLSLNFIF